MMHMFGYGNSGWWIWMIIQMALGIAVVVGLIIWITLYAIKSNNLFINCTSSRADRISSTCPFFIICITHDYV